MALNRAAEAARRGDLSTIESLPSEQLQSVLKSQDEDGR